MLPSPPQVMVNDLTIPIPQYPPFKLRSSLIDQDPVIWVHLLEAYIKFFRYLLHEAENGPKILSVQSQQQLQLFLKVYLAETAQEDTQVFSLGSINPDIKSNTYALKVYVYQFIRSWSFVKLNLTGDAIWNFVTIYIGADPNTVRGLVDGSYKSRYNDNKKLGSISCIGLLHKHLETLVVNRKFDDADAESLAMLLGQHSATKTIDLACPGEAKINKRGSSGLAFAEAFVNAHWIDTLERLHANGQSIHAQTTKTIMVVSLLALSVAKVAKLAVELGINSSATLRMSPLFGALIVSEPFEEAMPGLDERLQFLRHLSFKSAQELPLDELIALVQEIFPDVTRGQAISLLLRNNLDPEQATASLLENPDMIATLEEYEDHSTAAPIDDDTTSIPQSLLERFSNVGFEAENLISGKVAPNAAATGSVRAKTLSAALRMIYDSDEDEPDDTYDDQDAAIGADDSKSGDAQRKLVKLADTGTPVPRASSVVSPRERHLFDVYKERGATVFEKVARKTAFRNELKSFTKMSDEQIEGWYRMISRSPKTFRVFEEDYFNRGNPNKRPPPPQIPKSQLPKPPAATKEQARHSQATNEKNKASKANHHRKSGHGKKTKGDLAGLQ